MVNEPTSKFLFHSQHTRLSLIVMVFVCIYIKIHKILNIQDIKIEVSNKV